MPITTACPHCNKAYKLKDELAGKRVACGNPDCRQSFQVPAASSNGATPAAPAPKPAPATTKAPPADKPPPKPAANGKAAAAPPPPPPPPVDAEALAAAALADEPAQATPEDQRVIAMTCAVCEHKWDVPFAMQGKNVVCPDCRHRQKVPEQKVRKAADWRDPNARGPSMAKQEELEGVTASIDARGVSGKTLREKVIEVEYEPRPLSFWVLAVVVPLLVVGGGVYGVLSFVRSRRDDRQDTYMTDALKKLGEAGEPPYAAAEVPLFRAAAQVAAGEFAAGRRDPTEKDLDDAVKHLNSARQELEAAPRSAAREMLVEELALAWLKLGGNDEEVGLGTRLRWTRAPGNARGVQLGKAFNVQEEIGRALALLKQEGKAAGLDTQLDAVRRVARALAERGQPDVIAGITAQAVDEANQPAATAEAAAETFRVTGDAAKARAAVEELKPFFPAAPGRGPVPAAVQALAQAVEPPITGMPFANEPKAGDPTPQARQAFVMLYLLQKKDAEALELAKRGGGTPVPKLQALALVAEWSANPADAVNAATELVSAEVAKKDKGVTLPDIHLIRVARQAGRAGMADKGAALAAAAGKDEPTKAWIKAEAARHALAARGDGKPADEAAAEVPADPKEYHVGHAWARLALARYNAKVADPVGTYEAWGANTLQPFGLAGLALGRQDRDRK